MTEETDEDVNVVTDTSVHKAIGAELQQARRALKLHRTEVVRRLEYKITVQTLGNYESGNRACGLLRLVELCQIYDIPASVLIEVALQRAGIEENPHFVRVDLTAVIASSGPRFAGLRRWARNRRAVDPHGNFVRLSREVINEMAAALNLSLVELVEQLRTFTPARIPCRIAWEQGVSRD